MKTNNMYLSKFCCICMNTSDLKHLFTMDNEGVSHYNKLTSSIAEMDFKEMNDQRLICGECCVTLNTVYNFRQTCLRSKANLINYISQLQSVSYASGTLSDPLKDVMREIMVVKQEIEIKCENEDSSHSFAANNGHSGCETESYEESIQFPASVKEECESEEDATADHVNEDTNSDIEDETNMEDEIDIEEHLLVKEEPMSSTEAPQDGSTGQATSEQPEESKSQFTRHTLIHSDETLHKRVMCKKGFNSEANLSLHTQMHSRSYGCEICKKIFRHKGGLTKHMLVHTGEKPYECDICKKIFSQNGSLTRHMLLHSGEKPYKCEICNKIFSQKGHLSRHMLVHSDERPYKCDICEKAFRQTSDLKDHMQIHFSKKFKCKICNKSFHQRRGFATHMETHSDVRPYGCEICTIRFIHMHEFTKHMKMHTRKSPYKCEICNKMFSQKVILTRHMLVHTGERPYKCEICEKAFRQTSTLKEHMQIHSRQKM